MVGPGVNGLSDRGSTPLSSTIFASGGVICCRGESHPFGVSLKGLAALRAVSRSPYAPLRKPCKYAVFCFPNMITRVSYEGEIVFDNYLRIDNSDKGPDEAAKMIKETFHL